jgi:hypothetical protein
MKIDPSELAKAAAVIASGVIASKEYDDEEIAEVAVDFARQIFEFANRNLIDRNPVATHPIFEKADQYALLHKQSRIDYRHWLSAKARKAENEKTRFAAYQNSKKIADEFRGNLTEEMENLGGRRWAIDAILVYGVRPGEEAKDKNGRRNYYIKRARQFFDAIGLGGAE